jgi:hypothetical protein
MCIYPPLGGKGGGNPIRNLSWGVIEEPWAGGRKIDEIRSAWVKQQYNKTEVKKISPRI